MTKFLLLILVIGLIPYETGFLFSRMIRKDYADSVIFQYVLGVVAMLAVSEVIAVPMTLTKKSFSSFTAIYSMILLLTALAGGIRQVMEYRAGRRSGKEKQHWDTKWIWCFAIIYIPVIFLDFLTPHIYGDDTTYITMVNDMLYTDTMCLTDPVTGQEVNWILAKYALSSYWTWIAYIAKITQIHPLILCKSIFALWIVPVSYSIQWMTADFFSYKDERKNRVFLFFCAIVSIFGGFSGYTVTFRLYTWVWQSKAFLAIVVLPFLFYYVNEMFEGKNNVGEYVILFTIILASCSTTLTGTGLAVAMALTLSLVKCIRNRRFASLPGVLVTCTPCFVLMVLYSRYDTLLRLLGCWG